MVRKKTVLLKKLTAVILVSSMMIASGCAGKDDNSSDGKTDNSESENQDDAESGEDNNKADEAKADEESDKEKSEETVELSEEELASPINFTYQSHPMTLMKGDTQYASGNYYTIELEKSDMEKYPKLRETVEKLGDEAGNSLNEFFTASTSEIEEMFENGWGLAYELDHGFNPVRADGRVFSFFIENFTYLAGAHGYMDYTNYNFDPVTGKEIAFSDVVKNSDGLPEIIANELEKQHDELAGYFKDMPGDRESLINGIPNRLKDDAKGLAWTLDYDGIQINFEDYAMGSYAAGSWGVKIKFSDYPEIFTETYDNYKNSEIPDIKNIGKELKDAENVSVEAVLSATTDSAKNDEKASDENLEEDEEYGEDWWYHAVVTNPGWSAWTAEGIDTDPGKPSFELKEVSKNTSEWLDEEQWSKDKGIPLPESFPYSDDTYSYSVTNDAENGTLMLTVVNDEYSTLCGNYYFDEFISPPDQGDGVFADYTEPYIFYAMVKGDILYVSLGHRTYASSNPHKAYIVAIDTVSGNTLWKSDDLVCGSCNFIVQDDSIICGYGFTNEPDYIYIINRNNGKTQKKINVKSAPSYFIPYDDGIYVLTYNTEYFYKIK